MEPRIKGQWLAPDRIDDLIQVETGIFILALIAGAYLFYKIFLRKVSQDRHDMIARDFHNILGHLLVNSVFVGLYFYLRSLDQPGALILKMLPYIGLIAIGTGSIVFIKTARISLFEFLFFGHMKVGVPVVLINFSSLLMSLGIAGWLSTRLFDVQIASLLATSAVFSLILGLALQETLGNLFAGIAMQFDKPYEIGDWIEIQTGTQKWVGQVYEISWRATVLIGWLDEVITIPNRIMAQSQVANFSARGRPIWRLMTFRFPFGVPVDQAKSEILKALDEVRSVMNHPRPNVIVAETTDSWVSLRLSYAIADYGHQYSVADEVYTRVLEKLNEAGIPLAPQRLDLTIHSAIPT